jgi:hypothetical protein
MIEKKEKGKGLGKVGKYTGKIRFLDGYIGIDFTQRKAEGRDISLLPEKKIKHHRILHQRLRLMHHRNHHRLLHQ